MEFKEKYSITAGEKDEKGNLKIIISNDAFAVGDMIEQLINKIEHARLSLK